MILRDDNVIPNITTTYPNNQEVLVNSGSLKVVTNNICRFYQDSNNLQYPGILTHIKVLLGYILEFFFIQVKHCITLQSMKVQVVSILIFHV